MKKILFILSIFSFALWAVSLSAQQNRERRGPGGKEHFTMMDKNGDGKISIDEWTEFHEKNQQRGPGGRKHNQSMDKNGDGIISRNEWSLFHKNIFNEIDGNGDGSLTDEELRAHHEKMMKKHGR